MEFLNMELLEINNQEYAFEIHQRKENLPWLLMLHGFMGDHRVFEHLINDLTVSCNPITIDLLGHGQSSKPTDPDRYNESYQIDDIVQLVYRLNLFPILLYGYSMGGRLALKTAFENPDPFHGLILESTTNGIEDEEKRKQRQQLDQQRADAVESDYKSFLSKWEEAPLFQSPLAVDQELINKYHRIHLDQSPEAMAASLRGFGTGFMTPETKHFPRYNEPTMLIAGSADEKYKRINKRLTDFFSNVHLRFIEAGHRVHLDNPSELTNELTTFID
jgi:2-succinyl-6-hydroxy-2,4-cyclohexadiene-1-carboxylate synthase